MTVSVPSMPRTAQVANAFDALAEVDSTNAELRRRCLDDDPFVRRLMAEAWKGNPQGEGTDPMGAQGVPMGVLAAQTQTGGHGRLGRAWADEPGESFVTSFLAVLPRNVVFRPDAGWLTLAAGVAAVDALRGVLGDVDAQPLRPDARLAVKWPNDVFVIGQGADDPDAGRKLGGILIESAELPETGAERNACVALIVGIGLNLGIAADRLPTEQATSLQLDFGPLPAFDELRDRIGAALTHELRSQFAPLASGTAEAVRTLHDRMTRDCWTLGRPVEVRLVDGSTLRGEAESIGPDASLVVRDTAGERHVVRTGDVGVLAAGR